LTSNVEIDIFVKQIVATKSVLFSENLAHSQQNRN